MRGAAILLLGFCCGAADAETCIEWPWAEEGLPPAIAAAAKAVLEASPPLSRVADAIGPSLCVSDGPAEAHGTFDRVSKAISLASDLTAGEASVVLIHELRHLDQATRGVCLSPDLSMRDYARAVFALEADAMAVAALVAWRMRGAEGGSAFGAFSAFDLSADIAAAFAAEMSKSGDDTQAAAAAFAAWYGSEERRERYYVSTCEAYLTDREDRKVTSGTLSLDPATLRDLCVLPDGSPYACEEPAQPLPR
ncbi:hypothetical protein EF888_17925 [Silicimonas algicola]|uniref:DUF6782 domain-containing protein n=1 Tax=Silicimonas algicola TaxID=1826607 RepID=A0A316G651_9RHOB|nr:DUF6782 family putative metallopeptidase [Silicimonas algicola]AZQ68842.1 hypothetical protein EF888_17925 [Silicimonas algicola]PWK56072.1 hypothetical protein C8D95_105137 [Silicimonas algicola]